MSLWKISPFTKRLLLIDLKILHETDETYLQIFNKLCANKFPQSPISFSREYIIEGNIGLTKLDSKLRSLRYVKPLRAFDYATLWIREKPLRDTISLSDISFPREKHKSIFKKLCAEKFSQSPISVSRETQNRGQSEPYRKLRSLQNVKPLRVIEYATIK